MFGVKGGEGGGIGRIARLDSLAILFNQLGDQFDRRAPRLSGCRLS